MAVPATGVTMPGIDLAALGFSTGTGGAHTSRTTMVAELDALFEAVPAGAPREQYITAIKEDNCLAKRSGRTRLLTLGHLVDLYGLDPAIPVFAGLRYFWQRDAQGHAQLALLAASARDAVLSLVAPHILELPEGSVVSREQVEEIISREMPDRFSPATLKSTAQNINGSLTKSGHLQGRVKKVRTRLRPTPGAVGYALYLSWLEGARGEFLFKSDYCRLLGASEDLLMDLAVQAASRGWLVFKRIGDVIEVRFPDLDGLVPKEAGA